MDKEKKVIQDRLVFIVIITLVVSFIGGIIGGYFVGYSLSQGQLSPLSSTKTIKVKEDSATIEAVNKVSPSVVSIVISKDISQYYNSTGQNIFPFDDFFEFNFPFDQIAPPDSEGKQEIGGGTGFIISEDGLILTNKHVVEDSEADYKVILNDGTEHEAQVLGTDLVNDIAVLKIEADNLPVVELGDSDSNQIGQTVIAIGYALGEYSNTVTRGVISGLGRNIVASSDYGADEELEGVIQTDAAINPGNSGGPLVNLDGQVIGINTAINREGQLIGFAIPINTAKNVIDSVLQYGKIIRPYLGIRYIPITDSLAEKNNLDVDYGVLIVRGQDQEELAVVPGSPADKAGLEENDIILELGGEKIDQENTLSELISKYKPGDKVTLKILHEGDNREVEITLAEYEQ